MSRNIESETMHKTSKFSDEIINPNKEKNLNSLIGPHTRCMYSKSGTSNPLKSVFSKSLRKVGFKKKSKPKHDYEYKSRNIPDIIQKEDLPSTGNVDTGLDQCENTSSMSTDITIKGKDPKLNIKNAIPQVLQTSNIYYYTAPLSKCVTDILSESDISMNSVNNSILEKPEEKSKNDSERSTRTICEENFDSYFKEIHAYMLDLENKHAIKENYLENRAGAIMPKMREILINWLVEVQVQFSLLDDTLYLTVDILDRYLQEVSEIILPKNLQLVGVTCMFIAAKYAERNPPEIRDFVYITDKAYSVSQIREEEIPILKIINFNLSRPLPTYFLWINYHNIGLEDKRVYFLAKYVCELSIIEYKLAHVLPSLIALASVAFSLQIIQPLTIEKMNIYDTLYSSNTRNSITEVKKELEHLVSNINRNQCVRGKAIQQKYATKQFGAISTLPVLEEYVPNNM